MISIFHRTKARIQIGLTSTYATPGDEVEAAVTILPLENFSAREVSVDLACIETYYHALRHSQPIEHKGDLQRETVSLMSAVEAKAGEPLGGYVRFRVPDDAIQSIFGKVARIVWEIKVGVDVHRRRNLYWTHGLIVTKVPDALPSRGHQEAEFEKAKLTLTSPDIMVNAGGRIEGVLEMQSHREFSVKKVFMELECLEWAGDTKLNQTIAEIALECPTKIVPNQLLQWPFSFNMPSGALPSVGVGHTGVVWKVRGTAVCGFLFDLMVEQEIQVNKSP